MNKLTLLLVQHKALIAASLLLLAPLKIATAAPAGDIFSRVSERIVLIKSYHRNISYAGEVMNTSRRKEYSRQGSGVLVESWKVITNCHVVLGIADVTVTYRGTEFDSKVSARDPQYDLCELSFDPGLPADKYPPIPMTTNVLTGEHVYALGAPKGLELTLSEGIISAIRSYDDIKPNSLIQTTAPISPGSSGGGLFNAKGELIGITTQQIKEGQSLNFALSASLLEDFSERAAVYEKQREASKEFITQALIAEIIAETSMKWEPLLSISEKWLKIDPYNYMAWSSYGTALDGVKRYRDAIDAFNKSLSFVSTAAAYTGLAAAYISMGLEINESGSDLIHYDTENIVKAEQYLKSALQADPQYSDAWFWLGYIHYNKRNLGRAERYLKKSLKYSENTRTLRMLSHVNEDKGDQEKALSLLRRATEIAPDSIVDWLSFGRLAIELNRDDDVFRAYKNIRRLDKKVAERFLGSTSQ